MRSPLLRSIYRLFCHMTGREFQTNPPSPQRKPTTRNLNIRTKSRLPALFLALCWLSGGYTAAANADDLINGDFVTGAISTIGEVDTWTFDANAGEFALISAVDTDNTNLSILISITAPDGTSVTSGQGSSVSKASFTAQQSGTYTLTVRDNNSSGSNDTGTGDYRIYFVKPSISEHGNLINGDSVTETIELGDIDTWSFDAEVGDYALISLAEVNSTSNISLFAQVLVYAPDGTQVANSQGSTVSKIDFTATQAGTYTVIIVDNSQSSVNDIGTGDYRLYYVKPPISEHGNLVNGGFVTETIELGDIDTWSFDAEVGDYVLISLAEVNSTSNISLFAQILVYAPDGTRVANGQGSTVSKVDFTATQAGTYTVIILDNSQSSVNDIGTGDYQLYFVKPPISEHGDLVNGGFVTETIELGDIDTWSFDAEVGDYALISLAEVNSTSNISLFAQILVYAPDGTRVANGQGSTVSKVDFTATQAGTYTVIIFDNSQSSVNDIGTGDYRLHFVKPPISEHGDLINGGFVTETIELGDIDTWSFNAEVGDYALISLAEVNSTSNISLFAQILVYAPDGTRVANGQGSTVSKVDFTATQAGTYTVIILDNSQSSVNDIGTGDYQLYFVKPPISEHGDLVNGGFVTETIELGDIDTWSFNANIGDYTLISLADINTTNLFAQLLVYAPDGTRVANGQGATVSKVDFTATQAGTYTLIILDNSQSSVNDVGTGDYNLYYVGIPGANELGTLSGSGSLTETIELGDLDTFSFSGSAGEQVSFIVEDINATNLFPNLLIFNSQGAFIVQRSGNQTAELIDFSLPESDTYTLLIIDNSQSSVNDIGVGDYRLDFNLPDLPPPPESPVAVITAPIEVFRNEIITLDGSNSFDPDNAPSPLTYAWTLVSVPAGSSLSQADISNPTSVTASVIPDVSGEYEFQLTVSDGALSDSEVALVMVKNRAPIANAGDNQTAPLGDLVTLDGSASSDPEGDLITYQWQIISVPNGSSLSQLTNPNTPMPSFVSDVAGSYEFSLIVNDGEDSSPADIVQIDVQQGNLPPQAVIDLASDEAQVGTTVTLDGSNSNDPDNGPSPLTYQWSFMSVPDGSGLTDADIADRTASLTSFVPDVEGVYSIELRVEDGDLADATMAEITATPLPVNIPPVANAGNNIEITLGDTAMLDGSGSNDPDNGPTPLAYNWTLQSIPSTSQIGTSDLLGANTANPSFTPDVIGSYVVQLTVTDGEPNASASDSVTVLVTEQVPLVCDVNNDAIVDRLDIGQIMMRRNTPANGANDPADWNSDGIINVLDARGCVLQCTLPRCATNQSQ